MIDEEEFEPTPEQIKKAKAIWDEHENRFDKLESTDYDGIRGLPPDWVPDYFVNRFRTIRNWFMEDCDFTVARLLEWIAYHREGNIPPIRVYTNEKPVARSDLLERLGFLSQLKWIVALGRDKGLKELLNIDAADAELGKSRRAQMTEFGRRRGADLREDRSPEHERLKKYADKIRAENPERRYSKRKLAKILKRKLSLEDSLETIRKRI